MTQIQLPIKPHPNQLDILHSKARFNVIAAGRRFGKTEIAKIRCAYRAPHMRVWWIAPTHSVGQGAWRDFENMFRPLGDAVYINRSERLILFPKGGFLQVKAADSVLRSAGLDHVAIDEAAFCSPNLWPFVIRPMLLEAKGSADFTSSTNGRNWFWELFQHGLDPEQPDWAAWHYTSYDNPLIDPAELEDIKRSTPERVWQQEYMAAWLEDGGAVFRNLQACVMNREPIQQGRIVMGADWARHNDYTTLYALDTVTHDVVAYDRFNQIDWTLQRGRLEAMYKRTGADVVWAETNSIGEPNIEELRKSGINVRGFTTTASSKPGLINSLALAFEQEDIHIPNDPILLGELQAYTVERLPSGNFRYNAPAGMHDDTVIGLALAWHGASQGTIRVESAPDALSNFRG